VALVATSVEMRQICGLLDDMAQSRPRYLLIQGPQGSGKSSIISAAQAMLAEVGFNYFQLLPGDDIASVMAKLARDSVDGAVLIDDCDKIAASTLRKLVELRGRCSRGLLLTASRVPVDTSILLSRPHDSYIPLPSIEQRPDDLLLLASLMWERLGTHADDLASCCDESAVEALLDGIYPRGAWSLEQILAAIHELVDSSGSQLAEHSLPRISYHDLSPIFMRHVRESMPSAPVVPTNAVVVVEGDTDERYLRCAAHLAKVRHGWNLLEGLDIRSAGVGRGGGGSVVVERLLELQRDGIAAVGLFDYDGPGRGAFDMAGRHKLGRLLLPVTFDSLQRNPEIAAVEIEDLLPVSLLAAFYSQHREMQPEERHWRLGRWRIVPKGIDKDALATWVSMAATYEDVERLVYVLSLIRDRLSLPCPAVLRSKSWVVSLSPGLSDGESSMTT
jgi:hypothetical protein